MILRHHTKAADVCILEFETFACKRIEKKGLKTIKMMAWKKSQSNWSKD